MALTIALAAAAAVGSLAVGTAPASAWHRYYHGYDGGPVAVGALAAPVVYPAPAYVAPSYRVVATRVVYGAPRTRVMDRAPHHMRRVVHR